ncbi:CD209 antigen-like protein C [Brachyhypopomus gauderio]|uniref:CD209 antigen-like protein C n=1 Tax=Brachyhypopomus gauderio TaxID=698409 RepID=UPI004042EF07
MESIYENSNIEPSKRLSNEISADASEHTVQPVRERRPPSSNRTLKVLVIALSVLLLCALGAVCTLGSLYFSKMLYFHNTSGCHQCGLCEEGWMAFGLKCYNFSAAKLNWTQSQDHCGDQGGHLVIITSQAEQGFVSSRVNETHWIGLNDLETEGKWMWVNGKPLNHVTFWYMRPNVPGEPDNWKFEDPSGENCASLGNEGGNTSRWFDSSCRKLKKFICESRMLLLI